MKNKDYIYKIFVYTHIKFFDIYCNSIHETSVCYESLAKMALINKKCPTSQKATAWYFEIKT